MTAPSIRVAKTPHGDGRNALAIFLELLKRHGLKVTLRGDGGQAQCPLPGHEDTHPSMSFRAGDRSPLVAHCQGCGADLPKMLDALGATPEERDTILGGKPYSPRAPIPKSDAERIEHTYHDAAGQPVARKVRLMRGGITATWSDGGGKRIWWEHEHGGTWRSRTVWEKQLPGVPWPAAPRVLYRLPEVLAAIRDGRTVYIAEGERCVDALVSLGLTVSRDGLAYS